VAAMLLQVTKMSS